MGDTFFVWVSGRNTHSSRQPEESNGLILQTARIATNLSTADKPICAETAMPFPVTEISCDVQQQEKLLHAWQQQYTQLSGGCFAGSVSSLTLPGLKLFRESMSRAVFQAGALPSSKLAFGVPLAGRGRSLLCGETAGHDLLLFSGPMGFEFLSPDDFEFYGVEIDCTALGDSRAARLADALEHCLQHHALACRRRLLTG